MIYGQNPSKESRPIQTDATGKLLFSSADTAGPLGTQADAAAGSDTGTFSLIALFKRLLQKATSGLRMTAGAGSSVTAQIANGASVSGTFDFGTDQRPCRIIMPGTWTTADLTVQTSIDGATWNNLHDVYGTEYTIKAAASRSINLPIADFLGVRYMRLRSGTSGSPVNQAAERSITIVTLGA